MCSGIGKCIFCYCIQCCRCKFFIELPIMGNIYTHKYYSFCYEKSIVLKQTQLVQQMVTQVTPTVRAVMQKLLTVKLSLQQAPTPTANGQWTQPTTRRCQEHVPLAVTLKNLQFTLQDVHFSSRTSSRCATTSTSQDTEVTLLQRVFLSGQRMNMQV